VSRIACCLLLAGCAATSPKPISDDTAPVGTDSATTLTDSVHSDTAPTDSDTTPTDSDTGTVDTAPVDTGTPPSPLTAADCFASIWGDDPPVDYDQFAPVIGSHCLGTNHQDITGVERVVFIGDSITVGSPPTAADDWYRNRVADALVTRFGLEAPAWDWENVDLVDGVTYTQESGDFASCAKWGARTDDLLMKPHEQLEACMPEETRDAVTLVIMTIGGNDIYSLLEDVSAGVDEATMRATFADAMALMRDAAEWVVEPGRFPNGAFLVFANTYDFTDLDAAEDMALCPGAELIGMTAPLEDPVLWDILRSSQEEFMSIAVDTQTDMIFLGEQFCGHGYANAEPGGRCYRGPDTDLWLDLTCMHPDDLGHAAIADMVLGVVDE
jgi:hypothetical protein